MKWQMAIAAAILSVAAVGQSAAQDEPADGSTWAIVISVQVCEDDTRIPNRPGAEQTGQAIFMYLVQETHGNIGLQHARLVSGLGGDLMAIQSTFEELAGEIAPEDTLLTYIALRTAIAPDPEGASADKLAKYFLPFDADLDDLANTAFTPDDLAGWLSAIPAKQKVLFLDAGFLSAVRAEGAAENAKPNADYLKTLQDVTGLVAATDGRRPLFEDPIEHPVLGFCLYTALQGSGDTNRDGSLTFGEFSTHWKKTGAAIYDRQGNKAPVVHSAGVPNGLRIASTPTSDRRCGPGMRLVGDVCMDVYEAPNQPGARVYNPGNWFAAAGTCKQAGKRLCTPEEWEKACEGPGWHYPYGNQFREGYCNIGDRDGKLERVASRPFCVSAWGIYDLLGNGQEWAGIGEKEASVVLGGTFRDMPGEMMRCGGTAIAGNPILEGDELTMRCCSTPK